MDTLSSTSTPTALPATDRPPRARDRLPIAVSVVGAALVVNGLFGAMLFFDSRPYSVVVGTAVHNLHYIVWTAALIAMSQIWPRLSRWTSATGRSIPFAVVTLAGVGAALSACAQFAEAFFIPFIGRHMPALLDAPPETGLLVPFLGAGVVAMVGTAAVAVFGFSRRVFPRAAAVLLFVGAVAIPVIGPLSNLLVGAALVWIGISRRGRP